MEKRRLSTRNRGEPPLKKRTLSPPVTPRAPPPPTAPSQPPEPVEEGLPFRLKDPRLLPTLPEPQDLDLSDQEYQTIAERSALPLPLRFSLIDQSQWCFGSVSRAERTASSSATGKSHPRRKPRSKPPIRPKRQCLSWASVR